MGISSEERDNLDKTLQDLKLSNDVRRAYTAPASRWLANQDWGAEDAGGTSDRSGRGLRVVLNTRQTLPWPGCICDGPRRRLTGSPRRSRTPSS